MEAGLWIVRIAKTYWKSSHFHPRTVSDALRALNIVKSTQSKYLDVVSRSFKFGSLNI